VAHNTIHRRWILTRGLTCWLEPAAEGTKLTLHHSEVPDGHTGTEWADGRSINSSR